MINTLVTLSLIYFLIFSIVTAVIFIFVYFFIYVLYIFLFLPRDLEINLFNFIGECIKRIFSGISYHFPIYFLNRNSLKTDKSYLYIFIPHGLITFSQIIHVIDPISELNSLKMYNGAHSYLFRIPVIRELLQMAGCIPVDKSYLNRFLQTSSVSITVGGLREVSYALDNQSDDKIFIKNRKGFIKIAQQNSVEIVPIYCWNEQQFLTFNDWWGIDIVNKIISILFGRTVDLNVLQALLPSRLYKIIGAILGNIQGTRLYCGEPINVSNLNIDDAHDLYINKVQALFNYAAMKEGSQKKLIIE